MERILPAARYDAPPEPSGPIFQPRRGDEMRKTLALATVTGFLLAGAAGAAAAAAQSDSMHAMHDAKPAAAAAATTTAAPAATSATADGSLRAMVLRRIADAQTKLISLAEATPADKYTWRPSPGVRTTGEA